MATGPVETEQHAIGTIEVRLGNDADLTIPQRWILVELQNRYELMSDFRRAAIRGYEQVSDLIVLAKLVCMVSYARDLPQTELVFEDDDR
jgi:hypothetical protein